MLEMLNDLLKKIEKENQKTNVRAIGMATLQQSNSKKNKVKTEGKSTLEEAKSSISQTTTGLQGAVKGQFGKKITETFEKQKQKLDAY
ncbi:hypothetical protein [Enterococcus rotai]|uniref:hypothetical protein n=1 Tax=Enterococcus rotai TaxID=118060 RepID=UPI0035C69656